MVERWFSLLSRGRLRILAAFAAAALLAAVGAATAAEPMTLSRASAPRTVSGEGDTTLLVEGPFGLKWESAGGRFSIQATPEGKTPPAGGGATVLTAPAKTSAAASTQGKAHGGLRVRGSKNYLVTIAASGPWTVTVTW